MDIPHPFDVTNTSSKAPAAESYIYTNISYYFDTEDEARLALAKAIDEFPPTATGDVEYSEVSLSEDGTHYVYSKKMRFVKPTHTYELYYGVSFTITKTELVPDSTWKASYTQTRTETVPDYQWAASYKITRTDTYEVPVTPETPTTPTARPAAATPAPKKSAPTEAAAALPQTGDATNPAAPAVLALAGAALVAASHRKRTSDRSE